MFRETEIFILKHIANDNQYIKDCRAGETP